MISFSDFKFYLTFLTTAILIWKASAWVNRKQNLIEVFIREVSCFMQSTTSIIDRIETNHLAHQERYLKAIAKAIAKANSVDVEDNSDAGN